MLNNLWNWVKEQAARWVDQVAPREKVHRVNALIQEHLPGLGELTKLEIDKEANKIRLEFLLGGEARSIKLTANYALKEMHLKFTHVKADRPWVEALCRQFLANQPIQIKEKWQWIADALLE